MHYNKIIYHRMINDSMSANKIYRFSQRYKWTVLVFLDIAASYDILL